jgi:hypothetical protein
MLASRAAVGHENGVGWRPVAGPASSLVDALNDLVESVKRLGTTLGVKAWMENRYRRVNIDANADSRAVAETAAANVKPMP